jgi:hypothetical protein
MVVWIQLCVATKKRTAREFEVGFGLRLPVFMVAQEVVFVPVVHRGLQEQPTHAQVSHLLEAAVGGENAAADDAEAFSLDLLAEQVVFREQNLFVESAEFTEFPHVEQHEHSGSEGVMEA